ncbi:abscisic acid ABA receptor, partial [Colletotrichum salicis]
LPLPLRLGPPTPAPNPLLPSHPLGPRLHLQHPDPVRPDISAVVSVYRRDITTRARHRPPLRCPRRPRRLRLRDKRPPPRPQVPRHPLSRVGIHHILQRERQLVLFSTDDKLFFSNGPRRPRTDNSNTNNNNNNNNNNNMPITPPLPSCLLHGLAGTLYLLRLIRHWVPSSAPLVCGAIAHVSEYLLGPHPWTCPSRSPASSEFHSHSHSSPRPSSPEDTHGTTHGDLGIITQLVLTSPPLAASLSLKSRLAALLDLQLPNGDWPAPPPTSPNSQHPQSGRQQSSNAPPTPDQTPTQPESPAAASPQPPRGFASGPQGLVLSLLSLRPFFPSLHHRIDDAVERAREFLWARAVDSEVPTEEVNLFYGSLSTAFLTPITPIPDTISILITKLTTPPPQNLPKRPQKNTPPKTTTPLAKPTPFPALKHQQRRHNHIAKLINTIFLVNNTNTNNSRLRNNRPSPRVRVPPRRERARYAPHDFLQ